jgi:hypothetical protein
MIVIYQPRIRLFKDKNNDFHLAGEPDGFIELLEGIRLINRGIKSTKLIRLVTTPIPLDRHPVKQAGVAVMFKLLRISFSRKSLTAIKIQTSTDECRILLSKFTLPNFFLAVSEACDGWGDFSLSVLVNSGGSFVEHDFWFWGYANAHGVNAF